MIPLRDDAPRFTLPYVTWFLLAMNAAVFAFQLYLDPRSRMLFLHQFGLVPGEVTGWLAGAPGVTAGVALVPFVTSMFLHAGLLHILFNMWALWIFGDNAEDGLGHGRFLLLYLAAGLAAALLHVAFNPASTVPTVGASGAIGGVMGAYFVLFPSARVLTIIPLLVCWPLVWLPAWLVLGYWFVVQFLSGAAAVLQQPADTGGGGIAFWAHVGGFVAGATLAKLMPAKPKPYRYGR